MSHPPPAPLRARRRAFTLIELLVVLAILAILAAIAFPRYRMVRVRTNVAASKNNIRLLRMGMESFHADHGEYPSPVKAPPGDVYGVVSSSAAFTLTTPIAYVPDASFGDPFGAIRLQSSVAGRNPIGVRIETFNPDRSLLYFYYPHVAGLVRKTALSGQGYSIVSLGPDHQDSFILYLPYPDSLPASAGQYGVHSIQDTIYDPTNGAISPGDIAGFGGEIPRGGISGAMMKQVEGN